jgi:23S rRNA (uracil1939-C5)-methyltransferase
MLRLSAPPDLVQTKPLATDPIRTRPRIRPGDELCLTVDRLAYGGEAVGRCEGLVVFVSGAAPGETVRVRVRRVERRHVEGDVVAVEKASPERVVPRCVHFEQGCGGCTWQHVNDASQSQAKQDAVRDSLERLGGLRNLPLRPIIPAPSLWHYRNKMEFAFHPEGVLGLHPRGAWHSILPLAECFLAQPLTVALVKAAQGFAREANLSLHDPRTHNGLLRELVVRQSWGTGETMVGIVTSPGAFDAGVAMAECLAAVDSSVVSVMRSIRASSDTSAPLQQTTLLRGQDHITEIVGGLSFAIGVETFFQTNTAQAERLVALVCELAGEVNGALAIDLYCGVGMFALALASAGAKAVGIELSESSVDAARANARRNGLAQTLFFSGDARSVLPQVLADHGPPRVVVLDPPRAGAGGKVMRRIARSAPERIIYVSCNPTTLARDLVELAPFGYGVSVVQPLDLFPQTYHVETVVALDRRTDLIASLAPSPPEPE